MATFDPPYDTRTPAEAELRKAPLSVVAEQANDGALWFEPKYITEHILQKALRRLHAAVEGKTSEECAREVLSRHPEPPAGGDGFAWLIEREDSDPSAPMYWSGGPPVAQSVEPIDRPAAWTSNHEQAIRFARKVDALRVVQRTYFQVPVRVCEHGWVS